MSAEQGWNPIACACVEARLSTPTLLQTSTFQTNPHPSDTPHHPEEGGFACARLREPDDPGFGFGLRLEKKRARKIAAEGSKRTGGEGFPLRRRNKMGNVFGEQKTAKEIVREQKRMVNRSVRKLEREIGKLKRDEKKLIMEIKKHAKQNQMGPVKIMAKDLVRIRKQQTKFLNLTAQLRAIGLQITSVQAISTMSESMVKVSKAMKTLNKQINLPELSKAIAKFTKENAKMEMKAEVMEDAMDDAFEDEEDEEEEERIVKMVMDQLNIDLDSQLVDTPGARKDVKIEAKDSELKARMDNL